MMRQSSRDHKAVSAVRLSLDISQLDAGRRRSLNVLRENPAQYAGWIENLRYHVEMLKLALITCEYCGHVGPIRPATLPRMLVCLHCQERRYVKPGDAMIILLNDGKPTRKRLRRRSKKPSPAFTAGALTSINTSPDP
jgi:hypothetical protein